MSVNNILLRHNYISIPTDNSSADMSEVATVMMNLSYYGYAVSVDVYQSLVKLSSSTLSRWWNEIETELKSITGDDRKIANFVVYKNFPAEVLAKTEAEYWIPQILMYWGFPNEFFTEPVKPREKMNENKKAIVLRRAKKNTLVDILNSYLQSPARWKDQELNDVLFLTDLHPVNCAKIAFKENLVNLVSFLMAQGRKINIGTGTDVLRLAAGLSDGDVSLREKVKFISFKKPVRRFILSTLENCNNLSEDVARRPELWKRLFNRLHPGDYRRAYPKTCKVMDDLYNDRLSTFNSIVENMLLHRNSEVLDLLSDRPGDFRRRLLHTVNLFGDRAVSAFTQDRVLNNLSVAQIVSLRSFLETINHRKHRVFPPKGNWNKLQIAENIGMDQNHADDLCTALSLALEHRLPKVKMLDAATSMIKLPNNGGDTSSYARGTVFPIPDEVKFIRTASYWENKSAGCTWFDNGWNFFDANWKSKGSCCWTNVKFGDGAVFSGDPTNSKEMQGRAAQLIDLYPEKLKKMGVRYAVWNILCFSKITFAKATDVFAALQWGKDPQKGNLFEPSRCQLSFPLTSDQLTKYICMIDLETMEMVYLDANLHGAVRSADSNCSSLEKNMPAFMEYIKSLPSVHDLFRDSVSEDGKISVLYSDKNVELKDEPAYVFKPENKANTYNAVDLNNLLV